MNNPTRRGFLALLAGAAVTPFASSSASASGLRNSSLGESAFEIVNKIYWGDRTPESLQDQIKADLWNPDNLEKAFEALWKQIESDPTVKEMIAEYKAGDKRQIEEFITDRGNTDESAVKAINDALGNHANEAFVRIQNGRNYNNDFRDIRDVGLQAFLLNVKDKPELAADYEAVKEIVRGGWQQGFQQFVKNTLQPILDAPAPAAATAPAAKSDGPNFK